MDKALPNDTEILIFHVSDNIKENGFIKGRIIGSKKMSDLSLLSSKARHGIIYTVLGENGYLYTGTYDRNIIESNFFFRTPEDHIRYLQEKINRNHRRIYDINRENEMYDEIISSLRKKEEEQISTPTLVKTKRPE